MPSEPGRLSGRGLLAWLGSTRLSLVAGFTTAALLILASFFVPDPRKPGALPFHESLRVFFEPPAARHAWFYALLAATALYGLNGLVGTWRSLRARRAAGAVDRRFLGVTLLHLGFLVGLVAHLVAGLGTGIEGRATLGSRPVELAGRPMHVEDLAPTHNADGSLRGLSATLVLGEGERRRLGFNDPVFLDGYRRWILVEGPAQAAGAPRFRLGGAEVPAVEGTWTAGGARYALLRVSTHPSLRAPMVLLQRVDAVGAAPVWLAPGMATPEGLTLDALTPETGLAVALRRNDGLPLVALGSVLFLAGIALFLGAPPRPERG